MHARKRSYGVDGLDTDSHNSKRGGIMYYRALSIVALAAFVALAPNKGGQAQTPQRSSIGRSAVGANGLAGPQGNMDRESKNRRRRPRNLFRATFDPESKRDGSYSVHRGPSDERLIAVVRDRRIIGFKAIARDGRKLRMRIVRRGSTKSTKRSPRASTRRRTPVSIRLGPRRGFAWVMVYANPSRLLTVIEYQQDTPQPLPKRRTGE